MYRMKLFIFSFAIFLFKSGLNANQIKLRTSLTQNKWEIVNSAEQIVFSEHKHSFNGINLVNGMQFSDFHEVNDLVSEVLSRIGSKINIRVVKFNEDFLSRIKNRMFFNVMMFDSIESFRQIIKKVSSNRFHFGGYYLITFEDAKADELLEMFQTFWNLYIHNVNVVTADKNGFIAVSTFVPFSELSCNKTDPIKIAEFRQGSFNYRPTEFFPNKFLNFHQCAIKVSTFESLAPSVLKEDFSNGSYKLYGRDIDVIRTLSEELNFKPDVFYILEYGGWGILFPNGSATASMGRAIRRETDFILGNIYLKYDRSKVMEYSYTYFLDTLVLVIPRGKLLTSFQKLARPFEPIVWVSLVLTILLGFIVIAFLQFRSKFVREFVFGRSVKAPSLNLIGAIFGMSQYLLPKANFSRSLLMMFILFCLVIRQV